MYFMYQICWSQTDQPMVIVEAPNLEAAQKIVKKRFGDAYYREICGSTDTLIKE